MRAVRGKVQAPDGARVPVRRRARQRVALDLSFLALRLAL